MAPSQFLAALRRGGVCACLALAAIAPAGRASGSDNPVSAISPGGCLSPAHPTVTVPVTITRTTADGVRGFSVQVQLAPPLVLAAGAASILDGGYLASGGVTTFLHVVDDGGGLYTVDGAILGLPCGATGTGGTLFTVTLARGAGPDGPAGVAIASVILRDCANADVASSIGSAAFVDVDATPPGAIADLAAAPVHTGNDGSGIAGIRLAFTPPAGASAIEVYRAPFGHYPSYDNDGGAPPPAPPYPPGAPWTLTGVHASGETDRAPARDFWYYVAFSRDACGNVSAVSNRTAGTLDYHLGDVCDPAAPGAIGDNLVTLADVSRLGAHYGIVLQASDPLGYLDVGPTADATPDGRPLTDQVVDFEDLMIFALDFMSVSAPQAATRPAPAAAGGVALDVPTLPAPGGTFDVAVRLAGAGTLQGASVRLAWDAAVVEPLGCAAGALLAAQGRSSVVLSPAPGTVDVALLGPGPGLAGEGAVAAVRFRVKAAGDPRLAIASLTARDAANRDVALARLPGSGAPGLPARTQLGPGAPDPFSAHATVALSLARPGPVRLALYDLAGRRVRSLVDGEQPAGVRLVVLDARSDSGARLAPGVYVLRLEADGVAQARRLHLVP